MPCNEAWLLIESESPTQAPWGFSFRLIEDDGDEEAPTPDRLIAACHRRDVWRACDVAVTPWRHEGEL